MSAAEIDAYRRAAFQGLIDRFQHTWIGMHAEYADARNLEGIVLDAEGEEVPSIFAMAEEIPRPTRHPVGGANRAQRRAAEAKRRKRA